MTPLLGLYLKALLLASVLHPLASSGLTITVDNEQSNAHLAIDGNITTFWQTVDAASTFPHYAILDLGSNQPVTGLNYIPRQDGSSNGNIGIHTIDVSLDNATWTKVAYGNFLDDASVKPVSWTMINARYIRITAESEAGNRGPWTSAAELAPILPYNSTVNVTAPASVVGKWGLTINFPIVPVALAILPSGSLLAWSSWMATDFRWNPIGRSQTSVWDAVNGSPPSDITVTNTDHDMFCPGLSMDFNGGPVVTGGNSDTVTSIYDSVAQNWTRGADMNIERGYQGQTTLTDGRIFVLGGSYSIDNVTEGNPNKTGEIYDPVANTWTLLPGCRTEPMLTNDWNPSFRADNHAWLIPCRDGMVLQAGPSKAMNWYNTSGTGEVTPAGPRGDDSDAMNGNAIMYDAVAGKVLTIGGATSYTSSTATSNAHILTIGDIGGPVDVRTINSMHYARSFHNSLVLPDGKVVIMGGMPYALIFNEENSIMAPEIWDPVTEKFTVLPELAVPRVYHSAIGLLRDGTVFSGGGGLVGHEYPAYLNHLDGQIYHPPYLFNEDGSFATRPQFYIGDITVSVGGTFTAATDSPVESFALIRVSSSTHSVNTDQRRIPLNSTLVGTNNYRMTVPADPGVLLPGYWMLFAINSAGVPSVSIMVKVQL